MIYEEFLSVKNREPTAKELRELKEQADNILDEYEGELGVRPPLKLALKHLDFDNTNKRYSGQGSDWAMYLSPRYLVNLGRSQDFTHRMYMKHLKRYPDKEGKFWWEADWERQFISGIK